MRETIGMFYPFVAIQVVKMFKYQIEIFCKESVWIKHTQHFVVNMQTKIRSNNICPAPEAAAAAWLVASSQASTRTMHHLVGEWLSGLVSEWPCDLVGG